MPGDCLKVPYLILVQPLGLAFLVIDFHRPAVTTDASDANGLPMQAVRVVKDRRVREVWLAKIDNDSLFAKIVYPQSTTIAIVALSFSFVYNRNRVKKRLTCTVYSPH